MNFLVQFIINLVIAVAFTAISRALAQDQNVEDKFGITGTTTFGEGTPGSFIMGYTVTAGHRLYPRMTWGNDGETPNAFLVDVIGLSVLPITSLNQVIVNGELVTLLTGEEDPNLGYPVAEYRIGDKDHLWVKFYNGTQTTTNGYLLTYFGSDPNYPWQSDMIGRGVAYVICTARVNRELFPSVPEYKFAVTGIDLEDPRSGKDERDNPIVAIRKILKGIYYGSEWIYGPQKIQDFQIPSAAWQTEMNKCDQLVTLKDSSTEKRYRFGLEVRLDDEPHAVIEEILKACNGRIAEVGGIYKVLVGEPNSPVKTFSDDDIVVTEGQTYDPFPGLESTHNAVAATYPDPSMSWAMKEAPIDYDAEAIAADDGRELIFSTEFKSVPYPIQVQRLMRAMKKENRRFRRHVFTAPPEWWEFEPLDSVEWTSSRNGYSSKQFMITVIEDRDDCYQIVGLHEEDPNDYSWTSDDQITYSFVPVTSARPSTQLMSGWAVEGTYLPDSAGNPSRPTLQVSFQGELDDVRAVAVQVRLTSTQEIVFYGEVPYDPSIETPSVILNGVFQPNTSYDASGRFLPFSGRRTTWSSWITALTPDLKITGNDIESLTLEDIHIKANAITEEKLDNAAVSERTLQDAIITHRTTAEELVDAFETLRADIYGMKKSDLRGTGVPESATPGIPTRPEGTRSPLAVTEALIASIQNFKHVRRLNAKFGNAIASLAQSETVEASINSAVAALSTALQAQIDATQALITQVDLARVEGEEALAAQILELSATIPDEDITVAAFLQEIATRAADDLALASRITEQSALLSITEAMIATIKLRANIRREELTRTEEDEALAQIISQLEAVVESNNATLEAALIEEQTVRATAVDALSQELTELTATVNFNNEIISARVNSERVAWSTATGALAQDLTQVQAELSDARGGSSTLADALSVITAAVGQNEDDITAESGRVDTLTTEITTARNGETSLNNRLNSMDSDIGDRVTSTIYNGLVSRVEATEDSITGFASDISDLQTNIDFRNRTFVQTAAPTASNIGDLWFDSDDNNKLYRWNGSAWSAVNDTRAAKTFAQTSAPTATAVGDLWIDTDDNNKIYRWNGSSWAAVDDTRITATANALNTLTTRVGDTEDDIFTISNSLTSLTNTLNQRNRTFVQTSAPTASNAGDLWFDSDDGNKPYRWSGSAWVAIQDTRAAKTFAQTSAPTATAVGDLWIDTDDGNKIYRWNGSAWVAVDDSRIGTISNAVDGLTSAVNDSETGLTASAGKISELTTEITEARGGETALKNRLDGIDDDLDLKINATALSALSAYTFNSVTGYQAVANALNSLTTSINQRNRTFVQTAAPTATNIGDLWFDSDDSNKLYRWSGSAWVSVQDLRAARTFAQTSAPTATAIGDLWIDTDDGNRIYRWNGSSWAAIADTRIGATADLVDDLASSVEYDPLTGLSAAATRASQAVAEIESARGGSANLEDRLNGIDTAINGKVSASALAGLNAVTFEGDTGYQAAADAITSVTSEIEEARGGEIDLNARLDEVDNQLLLKVNATALQDLSTFTHETLTGYEAVAGALTSVRSEIVDARGASGTLEGRLDAVDNTLTDKAEASAVSALDGRVGQNEDDITALSSAVTTVTSRANGASAEGTFLMQAEVAPAGVTARLGAYLKATEAGSPAATAGFFLDLIGGYSQFVIVADRMVIQDSAGTKRAIFDATGARILGNLIADGSIYGYSLAAGQITADKIYAGTITANEIQAAGITKTGEFVLGSNTATTDYYSTPFYIAGGASAANIVLNAGVFISTSSAASIEFTVAVEVYNGYGGFTPLKSWNFYYSGSGTFQFDINKTVVWNNLYGLSGGFRFRIYRTYAFGTVTMTVLAGSSINVSYILR